MNPKQRLQAARLYFVCEARPRGEDPEPLLRAVLGAGVDMLELREKELGDEELIEAAEPFRRLAADHEAPFILNDRPDLVEACGAGGVHVGREDAPVADARRLLGEDAIIGLSTHSPEQVDAACEADPEARPDYISVGPIWETPTKEGRPGTGLDLIEYAARHATLAWFAIGGIDPSNVGEVAAAGAERLAVVRAIRDAEDPEAAARELRRAVEPS